jgi:hypothetical protein
MNRFWNRFFPYQLWRFVVINTRMYLIARGVIGPRHAP